MQVLLTTTLSVFVTGIFQVLSCQLNVPKWLPIAFTLGSAMFINVAHKSRDTPIMNGLLSCSSTPVSVTPGVRREQ